MSRLQMAQSMLTIVVCVAAIISFVGVQGNSIAIGNKCTNDSNCCGSKCVDGVCKQTEVGVKCGNVTCRPDETCEYALVKCKEGAVCPTPPPKCFPRKDPIEPVSEKCGNTTCKPNETCLIILISCLEGYTCIPPPPKCIPKNPKPVDPTDPCAKITCKPGYTCTSKPLFKCRRRRSPRPTPICINRCAYVNCPKGYHCKISENNPNVAQCVPPNPCAKVLCRPGYKCESVQVQCIRAPCPPIAQCIPINPCDKTTCSHGKVCIQTKNEPTKAECVDSPCDTVRCRSNTTCLTFIKYCKYPPCSPPIAKCVPDTDKDPCARTRCEYACQNVPVRICKEQSCPTTKAVCVQPPIKNPCDNSY